MKVVLLIGVLTICIFCTLFGYNLKLAKETNNWNKSICYCWFVLFISLFFVIASDAYINDCKNMMKYDSSKYVQKTDTTYVTHNGQTDTLINYKLLKK